ncbi:ankyrin repeat [Anaeramoeba flamelloides]|uniref:Ankyrin repeat n=1 Tax=Anaeramoeba flamelloides TaxID=1746091 RepID=A0ABQ8YZT9_9EUKA|nr:ankyrin repeat [Anaeramoeba flamelloides]
MNKTRIKQTDRGTILKEEIEFFQKEKTREEIEKSDFLQTKNKVSKIQTFEFLKYLLLCKQPSIHEIKKIFLNKTDLEEEKKIKKEKEEEEKEKKEQKEKETETETETKTQIDFDCRTKYGRTIFHLFSLNPNINIVIFKFLIESLPIDLNVTDCKKDNLLHLICRKPNDCCYEKIEYLIEKGINVQARDDFNQTALHCICWNDKCNLETVQLLIEKGCKGIGLDLGSVDNNSHTALHYASKNKQCSNSVIEYLIDKGSNVDLITNFEKSALNFYLDHPKCKLKIIQLLMSKMRYLSQLTNNKQSFLHLICSSPNINLSIVQYFINKGYDVNCRDQNKCTALHLACANPNYSLQIIEYLLTKCKVNTKKLPATKNKLSPLDFACSNSNPKIEIIQLLIRSCAYKKLKSNSYESFVHTLFLNPHINLSFFFDIVIKYPDFINLKSIYLKTPIDNFYLKNKYFANQSQKNSQNFIQNLITKSHLIEKDIILDHLLFKFLQLRKNFITPQLIWYLFDEMINKNKSGRKPYYTFLLHYFCGNSKLFLVNKHIKIINKKVMFNFNFRPKTKVERKKKIHNSQINQSKVVDNKMKKYETNNKKDAKNSDSIGNLNQKVKFENEKKLNFKKIDRLQDEENMKKKKNKNQFSKKKNNILHKNENQENEKKIEKKAKNDKNKQEKIETENANNNDHENENENKNDNNDNNNDEEMKVLFECKNKSNFYLELIELLINKGADINKFDSNNKNIFNYLLENKVGNQEIYNLLLNKGLQFDNLINLKSLLEKKKNLSVENYYYLLRHFLRYNTKNKIFNFLVDLRINVNKLFNVFKILFDNNFHFTNHKTKEEKNHSETGKGKEQEEEKDKEKEKEKESGRKRWKGRESESKTKKETKGEQNGDVFNEKSPLYLLLNNYCLTGEYIKILIDNGIKFSYLKYNCLSPLMLVCKKNPTLDKIKLFLEKDIDVNENIQKDGFIEESIINIYFKSKNPKIQVVNYFLEKGLIIQDHYLNEQFNPLLTLLKNPSSCIEMIKYWNQIQPIKTLKWGNNIRNNPFFILLQHKNCPIEKIHFLYDNDVNIILSNSRGRHMQRRVHLFDIFYYKFNCSKELLYLIFQKMDSNTTNNNNNNKKIENNDPQLNINKGYKYRHILSNSQIARYLSDYFLQSNPNIEYYDFFQKYFGFEINTLNYARENFLHIYLRQYQPKIKIIKYLIKMGIDINQKNRKLDTPIYSLTYSTRNPFQLYKYLIDNGTDINSINKSKRTILHNVCLYDISNYKTIKYLIQNGININQKDSSGNTCLHIICNSKKNISLKMIKLFLKYKADPTLRNTMYRTPLECLIINSSRANLSVKSLRLFKTFFKYHGYKKFENVCERSLKLICSLKKPKYSLIPDFIKINNKLPTKIAQNNLDSGLHFATGRKNVSKNIIQLLLINGANPFAQSRYSCRDSFGKLLKGKNPDYYLIYLVFKLGFKVFQQYETPTQQSPVYEIISNVTVDSKLLLKFLILFLKNGLNVNTNCYENNNILHLLFKRKDYSFDIVKYLINEGIDINKKNKVNNNPLKYLVLDFLQLNKKFEYK